LQINVPFTTAGENCVSAANQFFAQDNACINNFRTLGEHSSMSSVQSAIEAICTSDRCRNHLDDYVDYLYTCRVGSFDDDDDDVCDG